MPEIVLEDFTAVPITPHEYQPVIQQLIKAGVNKVATAYFKTEEDATAYIKGMQVAARQLDVSALKRSLFQVAKDAEKNAGLYGASVSVRSKITRTRVAKYQDHSHASRKVT